MRTGAFAFVVLALACACVKPVASSVPDTGSNGSGRTGGGPCFSYSTARRTGSNSAALLELSGLAASRRHPGIYWSHNDSGNALELFAIREDGTIAAQIPLTGATNIDVEDIALGPCGAQTCVFLGDVGDNQRVRSNVAIYSLVEPDTLTNDPRAVTVTPFTYADGAHNVESLVVDPATGTLFVLTKAPGTLGDVYRIENGSGVKIASVNAPANADQVSTGADAHPDGSRILIRTYGHLWELRGLSATTFEDVWKATPVEVPAPSQPQSEAVAYRADGRGYVVGTEGTQEGLFAVDCRD